MFQNNVAAFEISPPQHHPKKACLTSILPKSPPTSQSQRRKKLIEAIDERELTKSLEILAESQVEGDLAIFILANLQSLGAL